MKDTKKHLLFTLVAVTTALITATAFADSPTVEMQPVILDNFDGTANDAPNPGYKVYGDTYQYTWKAEGSRFASKVGDTQYPITRYIQTGPLSLQRAATSAGKSADSVYSLGIQGAFERRGYNWIDVYPTHTADSPEGSTLAFKAGDIAEIPLQGVPQYLDMWVWGANLNYTMEAYVRDQRGLIHVIPMGSLRFEGWKNLREPFPRAMPDVQTTLPRRPDEVSFVKFRIWGSPESQLIINRQADGTVIPFNIYFAQLRVLSNVYSALFDGDDLGDYKTTVDKWQNASDAPPNASGGTATGGGNAAPAAAAPAGGQ